MKSFVDAGDHRISGELCIFIFSKYSNKVGNLSLIPLIRIY